ncbi:MAG: flagellar basal body L-ring protein FlgH [Candidatus Eremiobacterota bacterium]
MKYLIILFIIFNTSLSNAGSIFRPDTARKETFLLTDLSCRASQVGDIITVIVQPNTQINSTNTSQITRKMNVGLSFLPLNLEGTDEFTPLSLSGNHGNSSSESGKRQLSFSSTMSVTVQQILPNGNFLVTGHQQISIGDKDQLLNVTGVVRPGDVSAENTIYSSQIADLIVDVDGELGDIKDRRGILTRILDLLF